MLGWLWKWLAGAEVRTEADVTVDLAPEADVVTKVDPAKVKKVTVRKKKVVKKDKR